MGILGQEWCQGGRVGSMYPPPTVNQELWNVSSGLSNSAAANDFNKMDSMEGMLSLEHEDQYLLDQLFPENAQNATLEMDHQVDLDLDNMESEPPQIQKLDRWNSFLGAQSPFDPQFSEVANNNNNNNNNIPHPHDNPLFQFDANHVNNCKPLDINLLYPMNSPSKSNTGSCDTKEFLSINFNLNNNNNNNQNGGWGESEESFTPFFGFTVGFGVAVGEVADDLQAEGSSEKNDEFIEQTQETGS
eukprot:TRINITY_DN1747_c1_g1_i5.p1 TRINITY_DN1747_c1_g1~~TRINITY_DN1747_c1_g1_i5.p1  ORF type:complete len:245 (+),score=59.94 TRINITY_DN1747_c1_g1_i5:510-1244(+)